MPTIVATDGTIYSISKPTVGGRGSGIFTPDLRVELFKAGNVLNPGPRPNLGGTFANADSAALSSAIRAKPGPAKMTQLDLYRLSRGKGGKAFTNIQVGGKIDVLG